MVRSSVDDAYSFQSSGASPLFLYPSLASIVTGTLGFINSQPKNVMFNCLLKLQLLLHTCIESDINLKNSN